MCVCMYLEHVPIGAGRDEARFVLRDEVGREQHAGEEAQRREAHVARGRAVVHLAVRECVRYVSASGALA